MTRFRRIISCLIALALLLVPAAANAYAASRAGAVALDCGGAPCPMMMEHGDGALAMPTMPDCPGAAVPAKGTPMTPSACLTFCGGLVALPTPLVIVLRDIPRFHFGAVEAAVLVDHVDPPEPHPPKI